MTDETIKQLAEKAANELGAAEMLCGPYMDAVPIIAAIFTPAIREFGPCGKHPKVFWVDGTRFYYMCDQDDKEHDLPCDHEEGCATKVFESGHCTICAEIAAQVAAALREAAASICHYCRAAYEPDPRWSPANSNGKHFYIKGNATERLREEYCNSYSILKLIPDPSALDRRKP